MFYISSISFREWSTQSSGLRVTALKALCGSESNWGVGSLTRRRRHEYRVSRVRSIAIEWGSSAVVVALAPRSRLLPCVHSNHLLGTYFGHLAQRGAPSCTASGASSSSFGRPYERNVGRQWRPAGRCRKNSWTCVIVASMRVDRSSSAGHARILSGHNSTHYTLSDASFFLCLVELRPWFALTSPLYCVKAVINRERSVSLQRVRRSTHGGST